MSHLPENTNFARPLTNDLTNNFIKLQGADTCQTVDNPTINRLIK